MISDSTILLTSGSSSAPLVQETDKMVAHPKTFVTLVTLRDEHRIHRLGRHVGIIERVM